jgi:hypothetical protein
VELLERRALLSVAVADRFEPNDSYEAATNLGTLGDRTENGLSIHAAGNGDYFQFKPVATGPVSITFAFDPSQGDIDAFLLDSDRLLLDSSATTGSPERLDQNVTAGRTYFIKVIGFGGATQADYDMAIDGPAAPTGGDADDQTAEARLVSVGGSVTDTISSGTDVDLYKFTVAAGRKLAFDLDRTSGSSLDSFVRLFNSSGSRIASNDNRAAPGETLGKDSYQEYTFVTAGTYYVGVSANGNNAYSAVTGAGDTTAGTTGGYVVRVSDVTTTTPPPPTGDTDDQTSEARSISIGGSATDSVSTTTDVDLFKFTARAGQKLGFDLDRTSGSTLDSFVRVFNSAGSRIASNDNRAAPGETLGKDSYLEYTFTTAGTYYVGVSGYGNNSYSAVTGANDVAAATTGGYKLFVVDRTAVAAASSAPIASFSSLRSEGDVLLGKVGAVLG